MAYIDNPFKVGQYAQCINDRFPEIITTNEDKSHLGEQPKNYPKLGKFYCVDEVLGEFIRFDEFDCHDEDSSHFGWSWWFHTHFKPLTDEEFEEEYNKVMQRVGLNP